MASRSLGSLTIDLIARTFGFEQGMDKAARTADKRMKEIEASAKRVGTVIGTVLAVGATAAGAAIIRLTNDAIKNADAIRDLSIQVGASTETLSAYAYAAKQTGTDIDELGKGLLRLSKNATAALDPKSRQANLFEALLGPNFRDQIRDIETLLPAVADQFSRLEEGVQKTALAQELFGRSGASLMEFLNSGSRGLEEFAQRARELGIVIDQDTANAADEFNDILGDMREIAGGVGVQIASALLPSLVKTAAELRTLAEEGEFANNIVGVLSATFSAGIWVIDQYNNAVNRTAIGMQLIAEAAAGAGEVMRNLGPGGLLVEGTVTQGMERIRTALESGQKDLDALIARQNSPFRRVVSGSSTVSNGPAASAPDLSGFFANPTGRSSKAGKSDAQKEAEQLQRSYDSLMETMRERIDLMGVESEVSKMLYRVTNGDLKALDDTRRQALVTLAEEFDARQMLREELEKEEKLRKEEAKRLEEGMKAGSDLVEDLEFELRLMKLGNAERAAAIQLRGMDAAAVKKYGEQVVQANRDIEESMKQIELMDGMRNSFANFFEDVVGGTKSIKDAFGDMLDDINQMIMRRIAQNWVDQLFGAMGTKQEGSAGAGWFGAFASWFGGGKAGGGVARANTLYEVNERGLEMATVGGRDYMLTGNRPVNVTPNHRLGSGLNQTNNFIVPGRIDRRTQDQLAQDVGRTASVAARRNG